MEGIVPPLTVSVQAAEVNHGESGGRNNREETLSDGGSDGRDGEEVGFSPSPEAGQEDGGLVSLVEYALQRLVQSHAALSPFEEGGKKEWLSGLPVSLGRHICKIIPITRSFSLVSPPACAPLPYHVVAWDYT